MHGHEMDPNWAIHLNMVEELGKAGNGGSSWCLMLAFEPVGNLNVDPAED